MNDGISKAISCAQGTSYEEIKLSEIEKFLNKAMWIYKIDQGLPQSELREVLDHGYGGVQTEVVDCFISNTGEVFTKYRTAEFPGTIDMNADQTCLNIRVGYVVYGYNTEKFTSLAAMVPKHLAVYKIDAVLNTASIIEICGNPVTRLVLKANDETYYVAELMGVNLPVFVNGVNATNVHTKTEFDSVNTTRL
jgi:hypothetical protein